MNRMIVNTKQLKYPIYFEEEISNLGCYVKDIANAKKAVIITDENVSKLYLDECSLLLREKGIDISSIIIKPGEENKNLDTVKKIYSQLMDKQVDRETCIIALGGGVVGDISGFVAATYLRGLKYVQVPTSLLAQVDSSVGGKTGVDFNGVKNIIGSFYQPLMVYINSSFLKTLPQREIRTGMAEIIKHSLICDSQLFDELCRLSIEVMSNDAGKALEIIQRNCLIKSKVVESDEKESGYRAVLNLGHTIGHSIETLSQFSLTHGESVSIGIVGAFILSKKLGVLKEESLSKVIKLLDDTGLPVSVKDLECDKIYKTMFFDKKVKNNKLMFVLPVKIGEVKLAIVDNETAIKETIEELRGHSSM